MDCSLWSLFQLSKGMAVYYTAYSKEDETHMFYKGHTSSIKEENNNKVFTIDGASVSDSPAGPVFAWNNYYLQLIGVITETNNISKNWAVHINLFKANFPPPVKQPPDQEPKNPVIEKSDVNESLPDVNATLPNHTAREKIRFQKIKFCGHRRKRKIEEQLCWGTCRSIVKKWGLESIKVKGLLPKTKD